MKKIKLLNYTKIQSNISFRKQLLVVFILVSILPVLTMGVFTYKTVSEKINVTQKNMIDAYTQGTQDNIDIAVNNSQSLLKGLASQTDLLLLLEDINVDGKIDDSIKLNNVNYFLRNVVDSSDKMYETIFVSDNKGTIIADGSKKRNKYLNNSIAKLDYYKHIISGQKFSVGAPYKSPITNNLVLPMSISVETLASKMGTMTVLFDLSIFTSELDKLQIGKSGYVYLINNKGTIIYHKDKNKILQKIENNLIKNELEYNKKNGSLEKQFGFYTYNKERKVASYNKTDSTGWIVVTCMDRAEYFKSITEVRNVIMFVVLLLLCLIVYVVYKYSDNITKPIYKLGFLMGEVSNGNLDVSINYHTNKEIATLNDSFNLMIQKLGEIIKKTTLSSTNLEQVSNNLLDISSQAYNYNKEMLEAVEEISEGANRQASDVHNSIKEFENIANSIEEVSNYTKIVIDASLDTDKSVKNGFNHIKILEQKSEENHEYFIKIYEEIVDLNASLKEIEKITETINAISEQTNLLSLNAAIEAARAGEAGRGFSIVADEIRKLAEQSSTKTEEIRKIIDKIEKKGEHVELIVNSNKLIIDEQVDIVKETEDVFNTIFNSVEKMKNIMLNINEGIQTIKDEKENLKVIIENISDIASDTLMNADKSSFMTKNQFDTVKEIKGFADNLHQLSINLKECIKQFNTEV